VNSSLAEEDRALGRRITYGATCALLFIAYLLLRRSTWQGSDQLHALMEPAATLLALFVGVLALVRFYSRKDNTFLFIGTGFIGTGLLGGYHTIISVAALEQYSPSPPSALIPWSGFVPRLFLSVLLWLSWVFGARETKRGESGRAPELTVYLIASLWTLGCFCLVAFVTLPFGYGVVPVFHRPQEFLPAFFLILAARGYVRKGRWKSDPFEHWLVLSIILCASQSVFMAASDKLYDPMYMASHVVRLLSYFCILVGLIIAMYRIFLAEENILEERTRELQKEIAERKQAQEENLALLHREQMAGQKSREERALAEAVFQGLPAIACVFDRNGRFLRWNHQLETRLGYSAAEAQQLTALDTVAEEDRSLLGQIMQQVFEKGAAETEVCLLAKDGTRVHCYLSGARIFIDNQPCLLGAAIDISKRKRAEEALRLSRTMLAHILDSVPQSIFWKDREGTYLGCNAVFAKAAGFDSPEAIVGKTDYDLPWLREQTQAYRADDAEVIRHNRAKRHIVEPLRQADGSRLWVDTTKIPLVDPKGGVYGVLGVYENITERKLAEEKVRLQAAALESAANAIVITDAQGTFQWVNSAFTRLTGYSAEEAVGQNPRFLKSGKQDESFYQNLWDTILAGKVWSAEIINRKKDGQLYTEDMTISPVCSAAGKITNFVAIKQDVTERKRIEQELKFRNVILSTQQEVSLDGILVVDDDNDEIISCNRRFAEMWGIPADVLATRSASQVLAVGLEKMADSQSFLKNVKVLDCSHNGIYQDQVELKDGKTYERYSAPMTGDDGTYYGRVRYYRDITERKRSEQALRQSEEKYRRLVDNIPDVVWTSAQDGHTTYSSPNVQSILGYTAREVCEGGSELWIGRIHPDDVQRVLDSFLSLFAENRPFDVEYQIQRKDGQWIWLHDRAVRTHEKDGVQYADGIFSDITARKRMEQKLREYEKVVESSDQMVAVVDRSYRVILVNSAFLKYYSAAREQLLGRCLSEVVQEGAFETVKQKLDECFQGKTVNYEVKRTYRDLGERDIFLSYYPIEGPRGVDRAACLLQDITERKKAEQSLQLFRTLIDQSTDAIEVIDPETLRFLDVNDRACSDLGYTREQFLSLRVPDIYPLAGDESYRKNVEEQLQRSGFTVFEGLHRRKDGSTFPVEIAMKHVVLGRSYFVAITRDITGRKKAELALRESEEQFRQLAENIREVFFILTPDPPRCVYMSPAYDQVVGKSRYEVYERATAWIDSVHPEDRERVGGVFMQCVQGVPVETEYRVVRPDGSVRWIHARSFPVCDSAGKFIRAVGIAEDISEQRRVLDAIQAAKDAAEAASRAKSEFLANMSHELRTPMNGIMGMTELALATELTSEQREYLTMVKSSADSLLGVINDILDFSKIEAGKLEFESIEFSFRSSLEATLKLLAPRAHEKGLELNCRVEPEVPEVLIGDPSRFRQIIVNLVGNAIKFTERGEVTVQVEQQPEKAGGVVLHVSVADTGIGIPENKLDAIFGAFTQADGSTTRRYGGTGLGLSISRQLVAKFGGRLWVESVVGQGSIFHFIAHFAVGSPRPAPLTTVNLKDMPVLVVDDNSTNRRVLEELLHGWGMKPVLTENGGSALTHLHQAAQAGRPFPLVLVDAKMPRIDGFTLVEQIKQDPQLATATIMMLTSAGQRGDAARCRQLGVAAYLTKPIGRAELLDAILHALGTKAQKPDQPSPLITRHTLQERKKGLRILLAEDNLVNRTLVVRLLEKNGNAVEVATDGREALAKFEAENFDLVLMDVQMPEMDGFEATAAIREKEKMKGGHLPIIAMTAHALTGDRERCLAAGMDSYIAKPIHVDELLKEIESVAAAAPTHVENG